LLMTYSDTSGMCLSVKYLRLNVPGGNMSEMVAMVVFCMTLLKLLGEIGLHRRAIYNSPDDPHACSHFLVPNLLPGSTCTPPLTTLCRSAWLVTPSRYVPGWRFALVLAAQ
jgi:hypothetical protein